LESKKRYRNLPVRSVDPQNYIKPRFFKVLN
jgi:hypothetical protein